MIFTDSIYPRTNANYIKRRLYFLWHFKFKYLDFHEKCVLAHEKDPVYRMLLQIFLGGYSDEKVVQKHTSPPFDNVCCIHGIILLPFKANEIAFVILKIKNKSHPIQSAVSQKKVEIT